MRGLQERPPDEPSLHRPLSGERGERGHLEGDVDRKVRQYRRKPVGEHALADARRPDHRAVVTACRNHLKSEPGEGVTPDLAEIRLHVTGRHSCMTSAALVAEVAFSPGLVRSLQ
ncbi:unannotated protein [freshwater metagenome]|uniref:Unannotated protein n=1 Tax=freshwater metagenome TaxID=449393 RepID=A0A6J7N4H9_9ZZZZ